MSPLFAFASSIEFSRLFPSVKMEEKKPILLPDGKTFGVVLGVGLLEFGVNLSKILSQEKFSYVVQLGICGAFKNRGINIGDVVRVDSELVGDLGVEAEDGAFLPWSRVGGGSPTLYEASSFENAPTWIKNLRSASGMTVNCCTGTHSLAEMRSALFDVDVESMEGAACLAVCKVFETPCYEVRAVSNFVSTRKRSSWKISEALLALKNALGEH